MRAVCNTQWWCWALQVEYWGLKGAVEGNLFLAGLHGE